MPARQRRPQTRSPGEGTVYQEHTPTCRGGKRCACPWRPKFSYVDETGRQRRKKLPVQATKAEALARLAAATSRRDAGQLPDDDSTTVEQWGRYFVAQVAPHGKRGPNRARTVDGYTQKLRDHVYPVIGRKRLARLRAEDLETVYARMRAAGASEGTVAGVHRILHRMLAIAERRGRVHRNVADLLDAPTARTGEAPALTKEETAQALYAAVERRNGARWGLGLGAGLRQSEALAIAWPMLDLTTGILQVKWGIHRARPEHGCGEPLPATLRRRDGREVPGQVWPCEQRQPGRCPHRVGPPPGLYLEPVKSQKSERALGLPPELVTWLQRHRDQQQAERDRDGGWEPCRMLLSPDPRTGVGELVDVDLVFRAPGGRPVDPRADEREWKDLLAAAGVPAMKLHGARHTTATLLLEEGEPVRVVQELMGHSSHHFTANTYQHVTARRAAAALTSMGSLMPVLPPGPGTSSRTTTAASGRDRQRA